MAPGTAPVATAAPEPGSDGAASECRCRFCKARRAPAARPGAAPRVLRERGARVPARGAPSWAGDFPRDPPGPGTHRPWALWALPLALPWGLAAFS